MMLPSDADANVIVHLKGFEEKGNYKQVYTSILIYSASKWTVILVIAVKSKVKQSLKKNVSWINTEQLYNETIEN